LNNIYEAMTKQTLELDKCVTCKELLEDCICDINLNDIDDELEELT